jgi:hypothetical protein
MGCARAMNLSDPIGCGMPSSYTSGSSRWPPHLTSVVAGTRPAIHAFAEINNHRRG